VTLELDAMQWEPVPGGTATAAEFIAARSVIREIHQQCLWSPWVLGDRAAEYDAALQTCGQWARTDPASPARTPEQYEADLKQRLAEADARYLADQARAEQERADRAPRYDRACEQARLALLEQQAILADGIRERAEILSGTLFPGATDEVRQQLLDRLERDISKAGRAADELTPAVGDPESVVDANGRLPAERRELALIMFRAQRNAEVAVLRARIAGNETALASLKGRAERALAREALCKDKARLAYLEQMPPVQAPAMCSECVSPAPHTPGVTFYLDGGWTTGGPCPAWPKWAERASAVRQALLQQTQGPPVAPPPPPARPIAVLAPGIGIEEVITQLADIQAAHPGAQVRKGRGHRWEIWSADPEPRPPGS
jgi:hypothetical protein